jgi:Tryptophan-rich Synechocystis species C-terminal domain
VTAGEFGAYIPIGAVATSGGGYDVAWEIPGANTYSVWIVNSGGVYVSNAVMPTTATDPALEAIEPTFNQDLNGDGVIGLYASSGSLQISSGGGGVTLAGNAPIEIGTGATLILAEPNSASVIFASASGTLQLAQPSTFTGQISNFAGNGTLTGSDHIDLQGINYVTVQDSYTAGALTVTDGTHTATLNFNGSYVLANFILSSDGSGGTLIIDPPVNNTVGGISSANTQNPGLTAANGPNGGAGSIGNVTIGPVVATESEASMGGSAIQSSVASISVTATDAHSAYSAGATAQSLTLTLEARNPAAATKPASVTTAAVGTTKRAALSQMTTEFAAPSSQFSGDDAATGRQQQLVQFADDGRTNGVAREIVTPHDVIRAIDDSQIAIKRTDANANRAGLPSRAWLFDDAEGTFVPPAPEPLTIVIDRAHAKSASGEATENLELAATAAIVSAKPSWMSIMRQFGRKAARVVSWESNE